MTSPETSKPKIIGSTFEKTPFMLNEAHGVKDEKWIFTRISFGSSFFGSADLSNNKISAKVHIDYYQKIELTTLPLCFLRKNI